MTATACPGCAAGAPELRRASATTPTHALVLPGIHCAACIGAVESTLATIPGIRDARVNLTRKRVAISAEPGADPTPWIDALARAGYEAHEAHETDIRSGEELLLHLGVAGFAMMNVMLLSVAVWSGADDSTRDFLHWISAAIALPAAAFSAQPFFRNAMSALRVGRLNMDVPISLAILLACGMSLYEVMNGGAHAWFDAALSLTFFLLAGRVLDQRLRRAARSAADNLAALEPSRVHRIETGARVSRPIAEIAVDDELWLAAGARVPVDAALITGPARIDRSAITGESDPVEVPNGAPLHAGDIVLDGPHRMTATAVGEDTTLRRITHLVATAESARGRYSSLADRAAAIYTPAVHVISASAFLGWLFATGDVRMALNVAIATLIITCPCALGLAVPAVAVAATSRLYRAGLLVKSDTALERLAMVETVLFDKTGTLTTRKLAVPETLPADHAAVLRTFANASDHPLCRELRTTLPDGPFVALDDIRETAGQGLTAHWNGQPVALERGRDGVDETLFRVGGDMHALPRTETLFPAARETIDGLKARGLTVAMVSGDATPSVEAMADTLGIEVFWAEIDPERKLGVVQQLQAQGQRVLMVGDGLNDTAALAAADASIAPGSALDASRNAADMVVLSGNLAKITGAVDAARTARRRVLENFGIAALYNSIAIPIAVAGFASPLAAAIAMSTSSITVILNAQRGLSR